MTEKQCVVAVPMGYSLVYRDEEMRGYHPDKLKAVLGEYESIRFHTLRFDRFAYQVTIIRKAVPPLPGLKPSDVTDVVAGLCYRRGWFGKLKADVHRLSTGQNMSIFGTEYELIFGEGVSLIFTGSP